MASHAMDAGTFIDYNQSLPGGARRMHTIQKVDREEQHAAIPGVRRAGDGETEKKQQVGQEKSTIDKVGAWHMGRHDPISE